MGFAWAAQVSAAPRRAQLLSQKVCTCLTPPNGYGCSCQSDACDCTCELNYFRQDGKTKCAKQMRDVDYFVMCTGTPSSWSGWPKSSCDGPGSLWSNYSALEAGAYTCADGCKYTSEGISQGSSLGTGFLFAFIVVVLALVVYGCLREGGYFCFASDGEQYAANYRKGQGYSGDMRPEKGSYYNPTTGKVMSDNPALKEILDAPSSAPSSPLQSPAKPKKNKKDLKNKLQVKNPMYEVVNG